MTRDDERRTMNGRQGAAPVHRPSSKVHRLPLVAAILAAMGSFCAADDYGPAPTQKPSTQKSGEPAFTDTQLQKGASQASNGIQLKLTADNLVLPERLGPPGQPLIVEPTALHLFFTNVSTRPIVLDAYNLSVNRLIMIVVGPEKQTVAVTRKALVIKTREALPIDFAQIEPGNTFIPFTAVEPIQFPGDFNPLINYAVYEPGEYKVQVIYRRPAGASAWQGIVVSNTLTFRIAGPMPEKPPPEKSPETAPQPAPTAPTAPLPAPPPAPRDAQSS